MELIGGMVMMGLVGVVAVFGIPLLAKGIRKMLGLKEPDKTPKD